MEGKDVIRDLQDLRHLTWTKGRASSGTAGTLLKSVSEDANHVRHYYKLSDYTPGKGIVGHECVNELIADRLLYILGVPHVHYRLIHARISHNGKVYETWLTESEDFRKKGESKLALDDYYELEHQPKETPLSFCFRLGWEKEICQMLVVDYLICNRDRHGANIEVLRARDGKCRLTPLYDHGLSFLFDCHSEKAAAGFDVLDDWPVQCFVGTSSAERNLQLIPTKALPRLRAPEKRDRVLLFDDLDGILSEVYYDKIWEMIEKRWKHYEKLCQDLRHFK